jgi:aryl-alcohol dehydrogenase-like predicted oxidoreductase
MREQGKTRWIGVSTTLPDLPTFLSWEVFDTYQIPHSALNREHEEWITHLADEGLGTIIRGGVARGEPGEGLGTENLWDSFERARLGELLGEGESPTAFLLRFTLNHPGIHTNIVGTLNLNHLQENVSAARQGPLEAEVYEEGLRRLEGVGVRPSSLAPGTP